MWPSAPTPSGSGSSTAPRTGSPRRSGPARSRSWCRAAPTARCRCWRAPGWTASPSGCRAMSLPASSSRRPACRSWRRAPIVGPGQPDERGPCAGGPGRAHRHGARRRGLRHRHRVDGGRLPRGPAGTVAPRRGDARTDRTGAGAIARMRSEGGRPIAPGALASHYAPAAPFASARRGPKRARRCWASGPTCRTMPGRASICRRRATSPRRRRTCSHSCGSSMPAAPRHCGHADPRRRAGRGHQRPPRPRR
jgi:hypothetical protein